MIELSSYEEELEMFPPRNLLDVDYDTTLAAFENKFVEVAP